MGKNLLDPLGIVPSGPSILDPLGIVNPGVALPAMPAPPPPPPSPAPMPDPENVLLKKKKQREAASQLQSGRSATILSEGASETLGGGY